MNLLCVISLPDFSSEISGYHYDDTEVEVPAALPTYTVLDNLNQPVSGIPSEDHILLFRGMHN